VLLKRPAVRVARAAYLGLERSPLAPLLRTHWIRRLKSLVTCMPTAPVLELLDAADAAGLSAWVAGGWGVDALAGRQTRRHYDLDLVVSDDPRDLDTAATVLAGRGYRRTQTEHNPDLPMPWRHLWQHDDGWSVEVLPVPLTEPPFSEPGSFAEGTIDGHKVHCLSASLQLSMHSGYPARDVDTADTNLLRAFLDRA
jgi:lincosamide nucleotidyltransferase A/C/D/E